MPVFAVDHADCSLNGRTDTISAPGDDLSMNSRDTMLFPFLGTILLMMTRVASGRVSSVPLESKISFTQRVMDNTAADTGSTT